MSSRRLCVRISNCSRLFLSTRSSSRSTATRAAVGTSGGVAGVARRGVRGSRFGVGAKAAAAPPKKAGGPLPKGTKVTVDNGKKATVVSYNLVDGLYILQIEGESSASLLGYKKTKSWVIH